MDGMLQTANLNLRTEGRLINPARSDETNPLRAKAEELEGVFLNTLVSQMFSSLDSRNMFGGGFAEETWRGMQAEQFSSMMAQNGGVGLADQIMADLIATQEAAQSRPQVTQLVQGAYSK